MLRRIIGPVLIMIGVDFSCVSSDLREALCISAFIWFTGFILGSRVTFEM